MNAGDYCFEDRPYDGTTQLLIVLGPDPHYSDCWVVAATDGSEIRRTGGHRFVSRAENELCGPVIFESSALGKPYFRALLGTQRTPWCQTREDTLDMLASGREVE